MNKNPAMLLMLAIGIAAAASGQGVYLDVKRLSSGKDTTTRYQSEYYSDTGYSRKLALRILLRNMSREPGMYVVETSFIATPAKGSGRWISDAKLVACMLPGGATTNIVIESDPVASSRTTYGYSATSGPEYVSGSKFEGYIVRVKSGDKVLATAASARHLEDLGRDDAQMAALLKAGSDRADGKSVVKDLTTPPAHPAPAGPGLPAVTNAPRAVMGPPATNAPSTVPVPPVAPAVPVAPARPPVAPPI